VLEPKVLLLDEPLASLDALLKRRLAEEFARIVRDTDATVVWVTHDQDEALMVADWVAIVNEGRVVACGDADTVMGLPADEWTAAFLGVQEPQTGRVVASGDGLIEIVCAGARVVAAGDAPLGSDVQFAVRPEDVLLFEAGAQLPLTTARNQMPATVTSLAGRGSANHAGLDAGGMSLAASVSRAATSDLHLVPGVRVLAVFKATAVRWRLVSAE